MDSEKYSKLDKFIDFLHDADNTVFDDDFPGVEDAFARYSDSVNHILEQAQQLQKHTKNSTYYFIEYEDYEGATVLEFSSIQEVENFLNTERPRATPGCDMHIIRGEELPMERVGDKWKVQGEGTKCTSSSQEPRSP